MPGWTKPIVIGRHAFGDQVCHPQLPIDGADGPQYRSTDFLAPGPGKLTLSFEPADGSKPTNLNVYDFKGKGVALAMYNTEDSIYGFAHASFKMALSKHMTLFLTTKKYARRDRIVSVRADDQQYNIKKV